jgi:hypothetical protein
MCNHSGQSHPRFFVRIRYSGIKYSVYSELISVHLEIMHYMCRYTDTNVKRTVIDASLHHVRVDAEMSLCSVSLLLLYSSLVFCLPDYGSK